MDSSKDESASQALFEAVSANFAPLQQNKCFTPYSRIIGSKTLILLRQLIRGSSKCQQQNYHKNPSTRFCVVEFLYDIKMEDLPVHLQIPTSGAASGSQSQQADNDRVRQVYHEIERIRSIRLDNLMRLWAIQTILYDKSEKIIVNENADEVKRRNQWRVCAFCRKNGEPPEVYQGHRLKDARGNVTCPILAKHKCEYCGATGALAHTQKYCPQNTHSGDRALPLFRLMANGALSTSHNHK